MAVFELSRQLLSRQQHYDWGLRALKTVLRAGGPTRALTRPLTPAPDTAAYDANPNPYPNPNPNPNPNRL